MAGSARPPGRTVVIGDVIDDILVRPAGSVRTDTDTDAHIALAEGGSAANVAAWLGHLGVPVDFHGRVGAGDADRHARALQAFGVRAHIDEHVELPTGRIVILVEGDHRTFLTDGGAARTLAVDELEESALADAAGLHLTGHSLLDPDRLAAAATVIERARRLRVEVVFDPSSAGFLLDVGPAAVLAAVAGVDILVPNLDEGRVLTGLTEPEAVAHALTDAAPAVALTLGAGGTLVAERGAAPVHVPAVAARVVDPTGAGDAFAAGLHAARRAGADLVTAARRAAQVAASAVAIPGGRPAPRD